MFRFSLIVTMAAIASGWWLEHRVSCLRLAAVCERHSEELGLKAFLAGIRTGIPLSKEGQKKANRAVQHAISLHDLEVERGETYRKAIWFPWLLWTIEDLPTESP